ncbi:four helix bundle protein [Verrucomicrobium spinosum]|uniref:four helix bundle protein n=1 Tax=Verrucomicrobium spinosum TaxID=2736 RepID=UPI00017445F2|nr:four helix bundle protein [Verrucomicrobium spinosum]
MRGTPEGRENVVLDKSYAFALAVIDAYKKMVAQRELVLSKQLLRCGTSIGANVEEAQAAQSTRDFISKLSIACKEARESRYWLRLLDRSSLCNIDFNPLLSQVEELIRLLCSILKSVSKRLTAKG